MRRSSLEPRFLKSHDSWVLNIPAKLSDTGKRRQLFYPTKRAATADVEKLKARVDNFGTSLTALTPARIAQAAEAYKILDPLQVDLLDAVRSYAESYKTRTASIPFLELFNLYLDAKQDRNPEYLKELRITRDRWPQFHAKLACDISYRNLEPILNQMTPGARNPVMRYLRAVFNYGIKRRYLTENPISRLDFAVRPRKAVETIPVDQVSAMLSHAVDEDLNLLPYLVFGFFAGVRPEDESRGLEWRDFDPVDGVLTVRPEISKTGDNRTIKLEENAQEWLRAYREHGGISTGKVVPYEKELRTHRVANRKAAGVTHWPNSAMRHTFCSHYLAKFEDVNRLLFMVGHTSPAMLWKHYYKAVPKSEAEKFWNIRPLTLATTIVPMIQAG